MRTAASPNPTPGDKLHACGLFKRYGDNVALHPIELKVRSGEILTLLGPSGSGKTTLLQLICGLVEPTDGLLYIDGCDKTTAPANKRDIGVVFQNYALFPHMTVGENVAFPLEMRRLERALLRERVERALDMVGLTALAHRFPAELSGGQQQRVALARCLVYEPSLILMDESLSALDRKLRESMQIEIRRIHRETGSTIVFVTHDQEEALALSDRICLMNNGRIEQIGTPRDLYERPATIFAANFIGISNIIGGTVGSDGRLATPDGAADLPTEATASPTGTAGALIVRPEHIRIGRPGEHGFAGRIAEETYGGFESRSIVTLPSGLALTVRQPPKAPALPIGTEVSVGWQAEDALFLTS